MDISDRTSYDVVLLQNFLSFASEREIRNYLQKISFENDHLRHILSLKYFLKQKDSFNLNLHKRIEEDIEALQLVLKDVCPSELRQRLLVLGEVRDRREVVLRQILNEKYNIPDEDLVLTGKRKSANGEFRKKGGYEAVSKRKIKRVYDLEGVASTSKDFLNLTCPTKDVPFMESASNSKIRSCRRESPNTSHSSASSESSVSEVNGSVVCVEDNKHKKRRNDFNGHKGKTIQRKCGTDVYTDLYNNNNEVKESAFNLTDYIREITLMPAKRIARYILEHGLDPSQRPTEAVLNDLLNMVMGPEVIDVDQPSTSKDVYAVDTVAGPSHYIDTPAKNVAPIKTKARTLAAVRTTRLHRNRLKTSASQNGIATNIPQISSKANAAGRNDKPATITSADQMHLGRDKRQIIDDWLAEVNVPKPTKSILNPPILNILSSGTNNADAASLKLPMELPEPSSVTRIRPARFDPALATSGSKTETEQCMSSGVETVQKIQKDKEPQAGPSKPEKNIAIDEKLFLKIIEMFPETCPDYLRKLCEGKNWSEEEFNNIITVIISEDHPKRQEKVQVKEIEVDSESQLELLKELLPDADPTFLMMKCETFAGDQEGFKQFIDDAMEYKNYPTMKEYLRTQQLSSQQRQYTTEFNVENFVKIFPDPASSFGEEKRKIVLDDVSIHYLNLFLRNKYDRICVKKITEVIRSENYRILPIVAVLDAHVANGLLMKSRRKSIELPQNNQNIPMLQELAYVTHKEEIEEYLKKKKINEEAERAFAKANGLLETCACCFAEDVMLKDIFCCTNGCNFCRECIQKSCEVAMGDGKTDFRCLTDCSAEITLHVLQSALPPKLFSKLAQKKALAEVKAAGIEELETCPFCDFATIPVPEDKIFRCLNADCMKESCRLCKEPSHVPLKCDEVEKDEDVRARVYVEDKMTEALLRQCWQCGTKFFKEEGCNKMTCSCGAHMCYLCKQPVKDYSHFNGIGGDKFHLCPLYSDNVAVNEENVKKAADIAKAEVDPKKLKFDPAADLETHYNERKRQVHDPVVEQLRNELAHRGMRNIDPVYGRIFDPQRIWHRNHN